MPSFKISLRTPPSPDISSLFVSLAIFYVIFLESSKLTLTLPPMGMKKHRNMNLSMTKQFLLFPARWILMCISILLYTIIKNSQKYKKNYRFHKKLLNEIKKKSKRISHYYCLLFNTTKIYKPIKNGWGSNYIHEIKIYTSQNSRVKLFEVIERYKFRWIDTNLKCFAVFAKAVKI